MVVAFGIWVVGSNDHTASFTHEFTTRALTRGRSCLDVRKHLP